MGASSVFLQLILKEGSLLIVVNATVGFDKIARATFTAKITLTTAAYKQLNTYVIRHVNGGEAIYKNREAPVSQLLFS